VTADQARAILDWKPKTPGTPPEVPFCPARVLLQDFTGVPVLVDLAVMRNAAVKLGADPARVNPAIPVDLVVDHSLMVDYAGSASAFAGNLKKEYARNGERYAFMRWGARAFTNLKVVPPGNGICHQVNLERLATVVVRRDGPAGLMAFPDTVFGADSHTTMVNGLGVLGWGVGGIEAEAAMLGHPQFMPSPEVFGIRLTGALPAGATTTDLALTMTAILRKRGVVGRFVEFCGPGLAGLGMSDRATVANMCPEYGATVAYFPVDAETLAYLRLTGRDPEAVALVEAYTKEQGLFRNPGDPEPEFTEVVEFDLGTVEPCVAGPRRPQNRIPLGTLKESFAKSLCAGPKDNGFGIGAEASAKTVSIETGGRTGKLGHGSVVIAAITSCTNTANPALLIAAGLLAKNAAAKGLVTAPGVKTSLAPGSRVVTDYLAVAGLTPHLDRLGFNLVGFGCTTCIGNSGPLSPAVEAAIRDGGLVAAAVLSGNRNFEGRIHPSARANYLASPPLVVAFAIAGRVDIDFNTEPIGKDDDGKPVFLKDIWPTPEAVAEAVEKAVKPEMFRVRYADVFDGDADWKALPVPEGDLYAWEPGSTYVRPAPYFYGMARTPGKPGDITGARVLAVLGDSVTTDHISPAGSIPADSPAGAYLIGQGVKPVDFNSYGSRRGNHEVLIRGTFAHIRLKNALAGGKEGGWTTDPVTGKPATIFAASESCRKAGISLIIFAGKEYGSGSSRDWAAKGPMLLGVRAVLAESFERIHRSNLVEMGVLPLEFLPGDSKHELGLTGLETYDITGIAGGLKPRQWVTVTARDGDGSAKSFKVTVRIDTLAEVLYYANGGILPAVLREIAGS
jgi:aconitate hydratase